MADRDISAAVWGETSALKPRNGDPQTLKRLHAVVAQLALKAKARGQLGNFRKAAAPAVDQPEAATYQDMIATIDLVEAGTLALPVALPSRAVLWEVDEQGVPRANRPKPIGGDWFMTPGETTSDSDYARDFAASRTIFRLYESSLALGDDEVPYVSDLTGTGMPAAPANNRVNWIIGLAGAALFFLAMFSLQWTATAFSEGYALMAGRQGAEVARFVTSDAFALRSCPEAVVKNPASPALASCYLDAEIVAGKTAGAATDAAKAARSAKNETFAAVIGPVCAKQLTGLVTAERAARKANNNVVPVARTDDEAAVDANCLAISSAALTFASKYLVVPGSGIVTRAAAFGGYWLFGWHTPDGVGQTVSLVMPTAFMILGVVAVLVGLGRGTVGMTLGALISPEGRCSLALAQVTFWTALILTSVVALAVFNGALVSDLLRYFSLKDALPAVQNGFFPEIPISIWGVLGISFGSTFASSLIKNFKPGNLAVTALASKAPAAQGDGGVSFFKPTGVRTSQPSIADWFLGEEESNKDKIDISRVQMVILTAGLLVTYGNSIFSSMRDIAIPDIFDAVQNLGVLIPTLPPVGQAMALVLGVSHATYLIAKASDSSTPAPSGTGG